ncbi:hypothetical protein GSY69_10400 [Brevibacterium sp. 5221]|uniref:DUF4439 domain-containing protein n=1 Tax=Brevibacterium rongguiense TaxID=2695267 RepID=A0A6N9H8M2_9MICO|nr:MULTISPECIES: hypothetical protein [Brevibacterium]MYM20363.1 hypothetical protein [Brevibacterium rongguiense]WAL41254.1 hypothetical protein BRM1_05235 [Brevibacterium sp. BRM-1]
MPSHPPPVPHGRRAALRLGAFGIAGLAGLGALGGCGLRIDRGPQYASPEPADEVRNGVARILAATRPEGAERSRIERLRAAVGPVWTAGAAPSASASAVAQRYTPAQGLQRAAAAVLDGYESLHGDLTAVLADAAIGAALGLSGAAGQRIGRRLEGLVAPAAQTASPTASATAPAADDPLAHWVRTCFQASYGYERLAVATPAASAFGAAARARVNALAVAAMAGNRLLALRGASVQGDRPAWQLPAQVSDVRSARALAVRLETALADACLPLFAAADAKYLAGAALYASARGRAAAGSPQVLRYTAGKGQQ